MHYLSLFVLVNQLLFGLSRIIIHDVIRNRRRTKHFDAGIPTTIRVPVIKPESTNRILQPIAAYKRREEVFASMGENGLVNGGEKAGDKIKDGLYTIGNGLCVGLCVVGVSIGGSICVIAYVISKK
jgi:hypothetical protein